MRNLRLVQEAMPKKSAGAGLKLDCRRIKTNKSILKVMHFNGK